MTEVSDECYAAVVRLRIRQARLAKGLRQTDVAALVGVRVREYQRLERHSTGKHFNPTLLTFRALGRALQLNPGELIKEPTPAELKCLNQPSEPRGDRSDIDNP